MGAGAAGSRTDLGAQTLEAADEDGGPRETLHGLAAVHRELARVQVLIDLARRGHCVVLVRALLLARASRLLNRSRSGLSWKRQMT